MFDCAVFRQVRQEAAGSTRAERVASQDHFIDLYRMLGVPTLSEADPTVDVYTFETGAGKTEGGEPENRDVHWSDKNRCFRGVMQTAIRLGIRTGEYWASFEQARPYLTH